MKNRNFIESIRNALYGIKYTVRYEKNMKFHIFIAVLTILLSIVLKLDYLEFSCIIISIGLVLACELINSTVEIIVDVLFDTYNEKAKIMKDISAGAVLISSIIALIVGLFIFGNNILELI